MVLSYLMNVLRRNREPSLPEGVYTGWGLGPATFPLRPRPFERPREIRGIPRDAGSPRALAGLKKPMSL